MRHSIGRDVIRVPYPSKIDGKLTIPAAGFSEMPPKSSGLEERTNRAVRLRVLHFASVINRYDFIDTVVRHVDHARFAPMTCVFSKEANIQSVQYDSDIPCFALGIQKRCHYPSAIVRLALILREQNVNILHAHHYEEALIASAAAALIPKCRVVLGRHYHDEIHLLAKAARRKVLLCFERFANRAASAIVVPSSVIRALLTNVQNVPEEKIAVIPYGFEFDAEKYRRPTVDNVQEARREFGLDGRFVIGNFGRHHKLKGQEYLLRGYAQFIKRHPHSMLLMVGDGPHGHQLRALAQQLGLTQAGSVIFTGWRKDSWRILEAADAVVHPTLHEALPQLMIEAMAKAKVLIITNVSGACDHARHLENAYVIRQRSEEGIEQALNWVYHNRKSGQLLGDCASKYVRSELSIHRIIPKLEALYEKVAC